MGWYNWETTVFTNIWITLIDWFRVKYALKLYKVKFSLPKTNDKSYLPKTNNFKC
jgi:hypothetical protein